MKKNSTILNTEIETNPLPIKPRSLRPTPSLNGTKSLKPKTLVTVKPIRSVKSPVVG